MSKNKSKNSNTSSIQETIQAKTHLSKNTINNISDEGHQQIIEMLEHDVPGSFIANLVEGYIKKSQEVEKNVIKAKIEEEIKAKRINEEIVEKGNKLVYYKFVLIGDSKYSIESKEFKSKRQCDGWIRLTNKNIKV